MPRESQEDTLHRAGYYDAWYDFFVYRSRDRYNQATKVLAGHPLRTVYEESYVKNYGSFNADVEATRESLLDWNIWEAYALPEPQPGKAVPTLDSVLRDTVAWANTTFPQSTPASTLAHLRREIAELIFHPDNPLEMADMMMILAHRASLMDVDLPRLIAYKLEMNKGRVWGPMDEHGVVEHVRDTDGR